jgi:hypothetical protein
MNQRLSPVRFAAVLVVLIAGLSIVPAALAQQSSRQSASMGARVDIQRLQDEVYNVGSDISRLRSADATRADEFQSRLDDLRDEVTYLKVKQRKEGVSSSEYSSLRNQIDELRGEVRNALPSSWSNSTDQRNQGGYGSQRNRDTGYPESGTAGTRGTRGDRDDTTASAPARQGTSGRSDEIPAGTEIDVRLERPLSSDTAQVEDRFTATTMADLYNGNRVLIPAGAAVRGVVTSVTKAGRVERTGKLTLAFDQVTVNGRTYPIHGTVEQALESGGYRQDAGKIGAGAGVGAIIGGILGGLKGALAGILIGGGGVVAATEGQDVNLPAGTVLRIKLDSPVTVR